MRTGREGGALPRTAKKRATPEAHTHMKAMRQLLIGFILVAAVTGCSRPDTPNADSARPEPRQTDSAAVRVVPAIAESAGGTSNTPVAFLGPCIVTDTSIGPVRLGMTLAEAREALEGATYRRAYDGEGIGSVDVVLGPDTLMNLVADGDEDEAIDWTKRIVFMQTFSRACRTAAGVHPGALVVDVERILGPATQVMMSEIESRQFITFERQPEGITFRLDYTGIFDDGARQTKRVQPDGKIFSISIARY